MVELLGNGCTCCPTKCSIHTMDFSSIPGMTFTHFRSMQTQVWIQWVYLIVILCRTTTFLAKSLKTLPNNVSEKDNFFFNPSTFVVVNWGYKNCRKGEIAYINLLMPEGHVHIHSQFCLLILFTHRWLRKHLISNST